MTDQQDITPARIGSGIGYFLAGGLFLIVGLFAGAAAAGGASGALATVGFCLPIAVGLIAVGFWVSLFGKLEQRLIDLQRALTKE